MIKSKIFMFMKKHFWLLSAVVFLVLTFFSYGFIRNLYFFREDYEDIYNNYEVGNQAFPLQGVRYIIRPLFFLFGNQPSGYFAVGLCLYFLFVLVFAYFIFQLTKNRTISVLSGMFLSTGFVGSEAMFWIEHTTVDSLNLILVFVILISYFNYFKSHLFRYWLVSFILYSFCLSAITFRAHYLIFIVFLADWYLSSDHRILPSLRQIFGIIRRVFPFMVVLFVVYGWYPTHIHSGVVAGKIPSRGEEIMSAVAQFSLLADLGNHLVPSNFQEQIIRILSPYNYIIKVILPTFIFFALFVLFFKKLKPLFIKKRKLIYFYLAIFPLVTLISALLFNNPYELFLGSLVGIYWIYILFALIFLTNIKMSDKKTIAFLSLCWFVSYIIFHLNEPQWVHPSWSRYLISSFPFFVATIIFIIMKIFIESQAFGLKIIGWVILTVIILSNIVAGRISPLKKKFLERSFYLKKFVVSLKKEIPELSEKDLFYFDTVADGPTVNIFDSFLAGGRDPQEIALAVLYQRKYTEVKVANDSDEFREESAKGIYKNSYFFFYDIDKKLHNLSSYFSSGSKSEQLNIADFSKIKTHLYYGIANANKTEAKGNKIFYESVIRTTRLGSESANDILELNLENFNFPSYKPVQLDIKLKAAKLVSEIKGFPYSDGLVLATPKEYYLTNLRDYNSRHSLLTYISERERFRRIVKVSSCGDEYPMDINSIIDGDLGTPWVSSRKCGLPSWVDVELPSGYSFSEARWISAYKNRLPTTYDYQISDKKDGPWQTILSLKNRKVQVNEYIVDKLPETTSKYFRMMIYETNDSLPAISEIELLKSSSNVFSEQADFLMEHPLTKVNSQIELKEIVEGLQDYLKIKVYPITDKFLHKNQSPAISSNIILDGREHTYSFILPAGGTKIKSILIEFPNIPISAEIGGITLKQIP